MKKLLVIGALAALAGLGVTAFVSPHFAAQAQAQQAQMRTASFAVDNMTCAACPITVRTAMSRVAGVRSVEVDFESKRATVTYDSTRVAPEAIAQASADAGYPARLVGQPSAS